MTLLHEYQAGTAYRRGELPGKDPHWGRQAAMFAPHADRGAPTVDLARPKRLPPADLWDVLRSRRSRRDFTDEPLAEEHLFLLLWASQGITQPGAWPFRTAPSAGALYPVETYVVAARVEGLEAGVYHWDLPDERLALVEARADAGEEACHACADQRMVAQAAAVFVWTAVWLRSAQKYGDRALRYAYLDAGHVAQNLYLACEGLGLGTCTIGAFFDDRMAELVGVDGEEESVLYAACVGAPR